MRNTKLSQKRLSQMKDMSLLDKNTKNTDSSHVFNESANVKDTGVTDKDTHIPNEETVNPNEETDNPDEETVNGHQEPATVSVKKEKNDEQDVKPNVDKSLLNGNSAFSDNSFDLFSKHPIKMEDNKEDSEHDDSSISVKGKLSDKVTGRSFEEFVNVTENGKQEDVDVDVSVYINSAQTLQADDKNTQYSGNFYHFPKSTFVMQLQDDMYAK